MTKKDKRLQWTPTLQVRAALARLEDIGLYGDTLSHIVNHVLTGEITRLLESKILTQEGLEVARKEARKEFGPSSEDEDK